MSPSGSQRHGFDDSTAEGVAPPSEQEPELRLLIFGTGTTEEGSGTYVTAALPLSGEVKIGRAPEVHVRVADASISRVHARLFIEPSPHGPKISIEDLSSANGTTVRGRRLAPSERVSIAPGEVVDLGATTMIVEARKTIARARRIIAHDELLQRIEEECERERIRGGTLAVLCVSTPNPAVRVEDILIDILRPFDVIGEHARGGRAALLLDAAPARAESTAAALDERLRRLGVEARIGLAFYPVDGRAGDLLLRAEARALGADAAKATSFEPVVQSESPAMASVLKLVDRVAASDLNVLVLGETGTGKQVIADLIHARSARREAPLFRLSCAALQEPKIERELFGVEHTESEEGKAGVIETMRGGTIVLEEVADLPAGVQGKLLRALEAREIVRVGGISPHPIDVRFVGTSNRDLDREVEAGVLRSDLFYRLGAVSIVVPPLRDRAEDVELFARSFLREKNAELDPRAVSLLKAYDWPGNVRELRNVIERALLLADGGTIGVDHLPVERLKAQVAKSSALRRHRAKIGDDDDEIDGEDIDSHDEAPPLMKSDASMPKELKVILDTLDRCGGNQTRAASMLGISRGTLLSRLDEYGVPRPRKPARGKKPSNTSR